jgi:hypothetical protein
MLKEFWQSRKARYAADALREQANARRHERRIELHQMNGSKTISELTELTLLESAEVVESSDLYGPARWMGPWKDFMDQMMDFGRGGMGAGHITSHKNRNGAAFPFYGNETEHGSLRDLSRTVVQTDPNAWGILNGLKSYTIGDGSTVCVKPRRAGQEPKDLAEAVDAFLEAFRRKNRVAFRQQEFFWRSRRDGEGFMRLFPQADGTARLRFVWPEQIKKPIDTTDEEWAFGRHTDPDDAEETLGWSVTSLRADSPEAWEEVPAEEMVALTLNVDSGVRRGIPDFSFGIEDSLDDNAELCRAMGIGSAIQARIAYIMQHNGVPSDAIRAFANADADYRTTRPINGQQQGVKLGEPGQVVHTNANTTFVPGPYNYGITSHIEVGKMLIRRACVRWNAPEWLGNADASSNSFANALAQESPFTLSIKSSQNLYADIDRDLCERVVTIAAAMNIFPRNVLSLVKIESKYPDPTSRDRLQAAQAAQIEIAYGGLSPQMAAEAAGQEWNRVKSDREAIGMQQGPQQAPAAPADGPPPPAMESLREAFSESDHPRDDHGQFVDKGEMKAAKSDPAKAKELRAKVTDPDERKKLDAKIGGGGSSSSSEPSGKHDVQIKKVPHPDKVKARPKSKAARKELSGSLKAAWAEARNALAEKYGTSEINDKMSKEEKDAEFQLFSALETIHSGNERDGPHDLGPVSDSRYAGYYKGAVEALQTLRASAKQKPVGESLQEAKDATGHEHKGKGKGGGQFVKGGGGGSGETAKKKGTKDKEKNKAADEPISKDPAHVAKVQGTIKAAFDHQSLFDEHEDGVIPLFRIYHEAKKRMPDLTVPEFHEHLKDMSKDDAIELHKLNEVHMAEQPDKAIVTGKGTNDERMYYFAMRGKNYDKLPDAPAVTPEPTQASTPASKPEPAKAKEPAPEPAKATAKDDAPNPASKDPVHVAKTRATIKEAFKHQLLFDEHEGGYMPIYRLYYEAEKRMPGLTVKDFHEHLQAMSKDDAVELHKLNETHKAEHPDKAIITGKGTNDERMYYYVMKGKSFDK